MTHENTITIEVDGKYYVVPGSARGLPSAEAIKKTLVGPFNTLSEANDAARRRSAAGGSYGGHAIPRGGGQYTLELPQTNPVLGSVSAQGLSGEHIYLYQKTQLLDAIRRAEGNPNYGLLVGKLAAAPQEASSTSRLKASKVTDYAYLQWLKNGRPGDFLEYLAYGGVGYAGWAPLGAANDPKGLNQNWLSNVLTGLGANPPEAGSYSSNQAAQTGRFKITQPGDPQWQAEMLQMRTGRQAGEKRILSRKPFPSLQPTTQAPISMQTPQEGFKVSLGEERRTITSMAQDPRWWVRALTPAYSILAAPFNVLEKTIAPAVSGGYPTFRTAFSSYLPEEQYKVTLGVPGTKIRRDVSAAEALSFIARVGLETGGFGLSGRVIQQTVRRLSPSGFYKIAATAAGNAVPEDLATEAGRRIFTVTPEGVAVVGPEARIPLLVSKTKAAREWQAISKLTNEGAARARAEAFGRQYPNFDVLVEPKGNQWQVVARVRPKYQQPRIQPQLIQDPQTGHIVVNWQTAPLYPKALPVPTGRPTLEATIVGPTIPTTKSVAGVIQPTRIFKDLATGTPDLEERLTAASTNPRPIIEFFKALEKDEGGFIRLPSVSLTKWFAKGHDMWDAMMSHEIKPISRAWRLFVRIGDHTMGSEFGEPGKELYNLLNRVEGRWRSAVGTDLDALTTVTRSLDNPAWKRIRAVKQGQASVNTLSQVEKDALDFVDVMLKRIYRRAQDSGIPVKGYLENYWPIRPDWSLFGRDQRNEILRRIAAERGTSEAEAEHILEEFIKRHKSGRPFGNLERERLVELTDELRKDPRTELFEYIRGGHKRIEEGRAFGPGDERIKTLLTQVEDLGLDGHYARLYTQLRLGDNPFWLESALGLENAVSAVNSLQVAAKLPFAVISNASQPINNLLIINSGSFARGLQKALRASESDITYVSRTGVLLEKWFSDLRTVARGDTLGTTIEGGLFDRWADSVLRKTGFLTVEGSNRFMTALMGREWVNDLAGNLVKAGRKRTQAIKALTRIGFNDQEVSRIASQGLNEADQIMASQWLVNETQFPIRATAVPLFWNSWWGRFLTLFKRFAIQQTSLMTRSIRQDPLRAMAVIGTAMPALGELVVDTRLTIRKLVSGLLHPQAQISALGKGEAGPLVAFRNLLRERQRMDPTLLERVATNLGAVGGAGIAYDMMRSLQAAPGQLRTSLVGFFGGPNVGDVVESMVGAGETARDISAYARGEEVPWTGPRRLARIGAGVLPFGGYFRGAVQEFTRSAEGTRRLLLDRAREAWQKQDWNGLKRIMEEYQQRYGKALTTKDIERSIEQTKKRKQKKLRNQPSPGLPAIKLEGD